MIREHSNLRQRLVLHLLKIDGFGYVKRIKIVLQSYLLNYPKLVSMGCCLPKVKEHRQQTL